MKNKIAVIGAGGHASALIDLIESQEKYEIVGLVGLTSELGQIRFGYEVIATDEMFAPGFYGTKNLCMGIGSLGNLSARQILYTKFKSKDFQFPTLISPTAYVSKSANLGEGTVVFHNATINAGANLGVNNIVNTGAIVEHGVRVGNHCHISTNVTINGNTIVGDNVFIGSGTTVREGIKINSNAFLKMCERVIEDVD